MVFILIAFMTLEIVAIMTEVSLFLVVKALVPDAAYAVWGLAVPILFIAAIIGTVMLSRKAIR